MPNTSWIPRLGGLDRGSGPWVRGLGWPIVAMLVLVSVVGPKAAPASAAIPSKLAFTTSFSSLTAGLRATYSLQTQDANGNPIVTDPLLIQLDSDNTPASSHTFFDAAGAPLPIADSDNNIALLTMPGNSSFISFQYQDNKIKTDGVTITATAIFNGAELRATSPLLSVVPAAASKLAFAAYLNGKPALPGAGAKDAAIGPLQAEVRDQYDNVYTSGSHTISVTSTSSTGQFALVTGDACGTFAAAGSLNNVSTTAGVLKFCYKDSTLGVATLTATGGGLTRTAANTGWVNVSSATTTNKTLGGTGGTTLTANAFSGGYTLTLTTSGFNAESIKIGLIAIDDTGKNAGKRRPSVTFLNLSGATLSPPTGGDLVPLSVSAPANTTTSVEFRLKDTRATANDTFTVWALAGCTTLNCGGNTPPDVGAKLSGIQTLGGDPHHFGFAKLEGGIPGGPQTLTAGTSSGAITVELRDASGNPIRPSSPLVADLTTSSATGTFYEVNTTTKLSPARLVIPTDASQVSFSYSDTTGGKPTITAKSVWGGAAVEGKLTVQINGPGGSKLAFTNIPSSITSGQSSEPISVQLQDASGNLSPAVLDTVVALSSSSPNAILRDANDTGNISSLTVLAGASSASFRYRDTAVGSVLITAAATGFTSATQQLTLVASGDAPAGSAPAALPTSLVPPPNTPAPPFFLSQSTLLTVSFSYFGPSAIVHMLTVPIQRSQTFETGCWSGPNATAQETAGALLWGLKPAGTEFIYFFIRGTRSYVFDTSFGNYCWVDLTPS